MDELLLIQVLISLAWFTAIYIFVRYGWAAWVPFQARQEQRLDVALNQQLLLNTSPRGAFIAIGSFIGICALVGGIITGSLLGALIFALPALAAPQLAISHIETKRRKRLDSQIVDGITTLSSGVRAGLTLVQSVQLLVRNSTGPIKQEFRQLMREYELGIDLHQAMRNASDRIGSSYYRLLFAAIQAHRERGGDMGQSLDRIAESIREIQRLEGRLQAITAQGRTQARMMGAMPFVIITILWMISPEDTSRLLTEANGRLLLLIALILIVIGFLWIRRIMQVDI